MAADLIGHQCLVTPVVTIEQVKIKILNSKFKTHCCCCVKIGYEHFQLLCEDEEDEEDESYEIVSSDKRK